MPRASTWLAVAALALVASASSAMGAIEGVVTPVLQGPKDKPKAGRALFGGAARGKRAVPEEEASDADADALRASLEADGINGTDLVVGLPGLSPFSKRRMLAGYVPVDGEGRKLFYWLIESDKGFSSAPLVLWTNGGPGCSGMLGLLTEHGPFFPNKDGKLDDNAYAWTKLANIVYIEQPVGVGFSKTSRREEYSDDLAAKDMYRFVVNFFVKYPVFRSVEFYVSSESYGGHYGPWLARELVDRGGVPNFRGVFIGNPLVSGPMRDAGEFLTLAGHQLLPKPLADAFLAAGCVEDPRKLACDKLFNEARALAAGLDPYGIDFPTCKVREERMALLTKLGLVERASASAPPPRSESDAPAAVPIRRALQYFPPHYEPCEEQYTTTYLNRKDVQRALHVSNVKWAACNDAINVFWNRTDVDASIVPIWKYLAAKGTIKVWIFSGDDDTVCATAQDQLWLWTSGLTQVSKWQQWYYQGQVAGYQVVFKGLTYTTVHGSGHMVPSTRSAFALELFRKFLAA